VTDDGDHARLDELLDGPARRGGVLLVVAARRSSGRPPIPPAAFSSSTARVTPFLLERPSP
jgi:hypothetical protein